MKDWPEARRLQQPVAGYKFDKACNEDRYASDLPAKLRNFFEADHVATGLTTAYIFVLRFMNADTSTSVSGSDHEHPTLAASAIDHVNSTSLTSCTRREVALDTVALFAFTVFYFVRHFHDPRQGGTWKSLLSHTLLFFLYLALSFNQPLSCLGRPEWHGANSFTIGAIQCVLAVLLLYAHVPSSKDPCHTPTSNTLSTSTSLAMAVRVHTRTNHNDLLAVVVYSAVIKFSQPAIPTMCSVQAQVAAWLAFGIVVELFFLKHFVRCTDSVSVSDSSESKLGRVLRVIGKRIPCGSCSTDKRKLYVLCVSLRTAALAMHLLSHSPHPIACSISPSRLADLAYAQSALSAVLTHLALFAHLFHVPEK